MISYLVRRLLLFIPTLIAISLLAFIISVNAPGDPVERMISSSASDGKGQNSQNETAQRQYWLHKLGLDLPVFYVSIRPLSEPQALAVIDDVSEKNSVQQLSRHSGNPQASVMLHAASLDLLNFVSTHRDSISELIFADVNAIKYAKSSAEIENRISRIKTVLTTSSVDHPVHEKLKALNAAVKNYNDTYSNWKNYVPVISFHPTNQYHRWIFGDGNWLTGNGSVNSSGIIRGDFGISYLNKQPVTQVIGEKVGWSLFFSLTSVLIAYLISIPIGVWAGARKDSKFDKLSSVILFVLYSLPSFWLATLLLMFFANPDVFHWFPASGIKPVAGYLPGSGWFSKLSQSLPYIILPLICYTYSSLAFLSRTIRVSMLENMNHDYIRTAMAKGLPFNVVVFRHAFRNSLLPLITVFANVFPLAIAGSVILETIFTIPGMGFETVHSIQNQNYPMIVAIFTITGILTMTGNFVSDILYAVADPRIKFDADK